MKTSKTTVAGIALTGTAALLAAGAAPLMVLAATDAAPQAPEAAAATQEVQAATVSNQVQLSTVEGTFGFDQSTVTPNAQIKHDFQGADKYLCGTQAGTDLASKPLDEWTLTVGGDVDNAIVIVEHPVTREQVDRMASIFNQPRLDVTEAGYLSNLTLRFDNECGRHKLLDLIGDIRLAGGFLKARVSAYKPGHTINSVLTKKIVSKILVNG